MRVAVFFSLVRWVAKRTSGKRRKMRPRTGAEYPGIEAGVGAELVGGVPEALFQRGVAGVFFRRSDPVHNFFPRDLSGRVFQTSLSKSFKNHHASYRSIAWRCFAPTLTAGEPTSVRVAVNCRS